jgi:transcription termination factor Rho
VSAESTQLSRATLESKDRGELQTIAAAMGGKPASRARKGEIVDLILELAGVKPNSGSDEVGVDRSGSDEVDADRSGSERPIAVIPTRPTTRAGPATRGSRRIPP